MEVRGGGIVPEHSSVLALRRPGGESNPRIRDLQSLVLPLDYQAQSPKFGVVFFREAESVWLTA